MAKAKENLEHKGIEFDEDGGYILDAKDIQNPYLFSTGSLGLDILSGGNSPGVYQLWGPDGVGKTFLSYVFAGQFQKHWNYDNCRVYYHPTEGRINPRLFTMVPELKMEAATEVLPDTKTPRPIFRILKSKNGECMYNFILKTIKQDKIKFFHIIDSSEGITCQANEGKSMTDENKMACVATLNTKFLNEATFHINNYGHIVLYLHQVRDKMQTGGHSSGAGKAFGGSNSLKHMANFRGAIEKLWTDLYIFENPNDSKSRIIGHQITMKLEKVFNSGNVMSKCSIPFIYNKGIDREREIATLSEAYGLVVKKGAWFAMDGGNVAQGYNQFIKYLKDNPDIALRLENEIKTIAGVKL